MEKYKMAPHKRVYHFTNGDTLVLSNVVEVSVDDNLIGVTTKTDGERVGIYKNNLNYFMIFPAKS